MNKDRPLAYKEMSNGDYAADKTFVQFNPMLIAVDIYRLRRKVLPKEFFEANVQFVIQLRNEVIAEDRIDEFSEALAKMKE